jgi:hypothetical protein
MKSECQGCCNPQGTGAFISRLYPRLSLISPWHFSLNSRIEDAMCNCMIEIPKKFMEKYSDGFRGKKVRSAEFDSGFIFQTGKTVYNVILKVEVHGQKKLLEVPVAMNYCPICGEKFE